MSDQFTVQEIADLLQVPADSIRWHIRKLFPAKMENGKRTLLNQSEITEIKAKMKPTSGLVGQVQTDLEMEQKALEVMSWQQSKIQHLRAQLLEQQPKVDFFDTVAQSVDGIDMAEAAQVLKLGIGRNLLFRFLRDAKILKNSNEPYQEFVDRGYFEIIEQPVVINGEPKIKFKTLVRQKGLDYIRRLYNRNLNHPVTSIINNRDKYLPASIGVKK
jgi:phage antirepressor YoqD-like protein